MFRVDKISAGLDPFWKSALLDRDFIVCIGDRTYATRADRGIKVAAVGAKVTCKRCNGLCGINPRVRRVYAVQGYGYPMLCLEDNMGAVLLKPARNVEGKWETYSDFDLTLFGAEFVTMAKPYEGVENA